MILIFKTTIITHIFIFTTLHSKVCWLTTSIITLHLCIYTITKQQLVYYENDYYKTNNNIYLHSSLLVNNTTFKLLS